MAALANPAFLYTGSDVYTAVTAWSSLAVDTAGRLIRPLTAPALGNERVYVATTGGTTGAAEPTWTFAKGDIQPADGSVVWQECTGQPAVNGDVTNTKDWNSAKSNTVAKGQIIKNIAGTYYFICSIAGTSGSGAEPSWTLTAGVATVDNTVTWICIGAIGNFAAFAAPHSRILNADAANWQTVAGANDIYVSSAHNESQGSALGLAGGQGTVAKPNRYISVANNVAPPTAMTAGAAVSTTGAFALTFTLSGNYIGFNFTSGSGANAIALNVGTSSSFNVQNSIIMESCTLKTGGTTGGSITLANTDPGSATNAFINLLKCTFLFSSTASRILCQNGNIQLAGGAAATSGSVPTTLFNTSADTITNVLVRDFDLSAVTGTILNIASNSSQNIGGYFKMENCKLGASVAMTSGTLQGPGDLRFMMRDCDSGTKNYRHYETSYFGTAQSETSIVQSASDGTTTQSVHLTTSANTGFYSPFEYLETFDFWNDTVGSAVTMTAEITCASQLTNGDIYLETEYYGSSAAPFASIATTRKVDSLASNTNVPSSAASWTNGQGFNMKLQNTITPQMKGLMRGRLFMIKPSLDVYADAQVKVA